MKVLATLIAIVMGGLMMMAISDLPDFGDPASPANSHPKVADYYLQQSMADSNVPNVVTSVLADYRSFDTMFETGVVFVAALAIFSVLLVDKPKKKTKKPAETSIIIRAAVRLMVPTMQLYALYVIAHGHHSPGGGFQGGVVLGASLILYAMAFGLPDAMKQLSQKWMILLSAIGVLIYSGIGFGSLFLGGNFLDYSVWSKILPATDSVMARSHGMLGVEIGVGLTVMCGMFIIYAALASDGRMDEGL